MGFYTYDMDTGTAGTGADFHTGTVHFGAFGTSVPAPDSSLSLGYQYRYRTLWYVRYVNTNTFGKFDMTSIPVSDTSVGATGTSGIEARADSYADSYAVRFRASYFFMFTLRSDEWIGLRLQSDISKSDGIQSDLRIRQNPMGNNLI